MEVGEDRPLVVGCIALFPLSARGMDTDHITWFAYVPSDGINILGCSIEDSLRITWDIGVMVVCPDLSVEASSLQRRTDVVLDEGPRLIRVDVHGRVSRLTIQGFVLDGDGINMNTLGGICLDVLDKVLCICVDIVVV